LALVIVHAEAFGPTKRLLIDCRLTYLISWRVGVDMLKSRHWRLLKVRHRTRIMVRIVPPAAVLSGTLLLGTPSVQVVKSRDVCPPLLSGAALPGLVMSVLAISASPAIPNPNPNPNPIP